MKTPICDLLGIEIPLLAFSHCRDVVAAVTNAGGFGVLGASTHTPERLEEELSWIDDHVDGKPYGADLVVPEKFEGKDQHLGMADLVDRVPEQHSAFVSNLLAEHNIKATREQVLRMDFRENQEDEGEKLLEV